MKKIESLKKLNQCRRHGHQETDAAAGTRPMAHYRAVIDRRYSSAPAWALILVLICGHCVAANVLIPLQTCGVSPAANRGVILTPMQALGSNTIPVMDKIQGTTDGNGNWSPSLMPGVYQAEVRPAWGQVGMTEFYFYVDPSNAVQDAFTNLLTKTNNIWPPNQYAYSAQASDARYVTQTQYQNAVTNDQSGVTLFGTFNGNIQVAEGKTISDQNGQTGQSGQILTAAGSGNGVLWSSSFSGNAATATSATNIGGIPWVNLNSAYLTSWMTNEISEWASADMIETNDGATINQWTDREGVSYQGVATYVAKYINGLPAVTFNGVNQIMTNTASSLTGGIFTNTATLFFVYRSPRPANYASANASQNFIFATGTNGIGIYGLYSLGIEAYRVQVSGSENQGTMDIPFLNNAGENVSHPFDVDYELNDDGHVFCITWSPYLVEEFLDGEIIFSSVNNPANYSVPLLPIGMQGIISIGAYSYGGGGGWANGGISEILFSTNQWSNASIDQTTDYFMQKYGLLKPLIVLDGDSIIMQGGASYGGKYQEQISSNFTGYAWNDVATYGESSRANYSNSLIWATSACYEQRKIALLWPSGINDSNYFGASAIGIFTNDLILESQNLRSNGWKVIWMTPPSGSNQDYKGMKNPILNIETNCWPQFADGIVKINNDPLIGQIGAWGVGGIPNNYFYSDGVHLTNGGYAEAVTDSIPVLNHVLYGTWSCISTTAPPPTATDPWTAQDFRSPGHFFSNSNGVWFIN